MIEHTFAAMGCEIIVRGGSASDRAAIEQLFATREQIFSRFIADSELNRVNARAGRPQLVSGIFTDTLRVALDAATETGGLVVPTVGAAIEAVGYTRDSSLLAPDPTPVAPVPEEGEVFAFGRVVGLSPGTKLDLNGVVKALAVDDALALLSGQGSVSAGGDLAVRGPLTVALPGDGVAELKRGAFATSGRTTRRWFRGGQEQHHLIDPRTGRPAITPWATVTACGATCVGADVAAKAAFLLGEDGPAWLDAREIPGWFVNDIGEIRTNVAWDRSMREAACT
jgi:thiamine biosynthesis lipoprotein